ncbi:hypothetical protein [Desulfovirgula thermocuniculi]|uniref:hypothetical protein n=1 Tax=Desulfovirgula thermocuniculi TaxID=348842 RepID=UPI0012EB46BD|nr:hypothetical protein [Desulfovirgula thermocuniculi]
MEVLVRLECPGCGCPLEVACLNGGRRRWRCLKCGKVYTSLCYTCRGGEVVGVRLFAPSGRGCGSGRWEEVVGR